MNLLKIIFLSLIPTISLSQSIVVIDKNKTTTPLFNDNAPLSLISVLKENLYDLGNYDLEGMSDSLLNTMSVKERSATLKFTPMYHDYVYDEYGEPLTVLNERTGSYEYVFIPPDTTYTSLDDIERIVLNITEGKGLKIDRIESIEFWKRYNGVLCKVLTLNPEILKMQGLKIIRPVSEELQSLWLDKKDPNSFWNQMKVASLKAKSDFERGIEDLEEKSFVMEFFPYAASFPFKGYFGGVPKIVEEQVNQELNYLVVVNRDLNENLPFGFTFGKKLNNNPDYSKKLESQFKEIVSIAIESDYPLIDIDPDSPNFGNALIIVQQDGTMEFVYPEPIISYLWCEYDNILLYAVEEFIVDTNTNEMKTNIVGICFTQKAENGKPEIVSLVRIDDRFLYFFEQYPEEKLNLQEWNNIFNQEIDKSYNTYDLSNPKDVKRLAKRNAKLKN